MLNRGRNAWAIAPRGGSRASQLGSSRFSDARAHKEIRSVAFPRRPLLSRDPAHHLTQDDHVLAVLRPVGGCFHPDDVVETGGRHLDTENSIGHRVLD